MSSRGKVLAKKAFIDSKRKGRTSKRRKTGDEEEWNPNPNEKVEEDDTGDDEEMDVSRYTGAIRRWNFYSYERLRRPYQYALNNDADLPYFHTKIQEDAYFGYVHAGTIHKHQYINMSYMMENKNTFGLVPNLHAMGLYDFLEHNCNWNDRIVRQFYATMEIDTMNEKIEWMTGKRRYSATFDEFAAANKLDNGFFANSIDLDEEDPLPMEQRRMFYEPENTNIQFRIGGPKGLRHHPAVINKIVRVTFMPKGGDRGEIKDKYWNVIHHIMFSKKFDVVKFMMNQLAILKHDMATNLYYAPYIMSLILQKTKFKGGCRVQHENLKPFSNNKVFQTRELTPFPEPSEREQRGQGRGQEVSRFLRATTSITDAWMGATCRYFDPFFQNMQNTWSNTFTQFGESVLQQMNQRFHAMGQQWQSHMDTSFQELGQHLHNTIYLPIMSSLHNVKQGLHNDIDALSSQLGTLSTQEQYQQLQDMQFHLEQRFEVLNNNFNAFSDRYNTVFPTYVPLQCRPPPYYPPTPPGDDNDDA